MSAGKNIHCWKFVSICKFVSILILCLEMIRCNFLWNNPYYCIGQWKQKPVLLSSFENMAWCHTVFIDLMPQWAQHNACLKAWLLFTIKIPYDDSFFVETCYAPMKPTSAHHNVNDQSQVKKKQVNKLLDTGDALHVGCCKWD